MAKYDLTVWEMVIRLIASIVVGGIVGLEREIKSRPAGMKTHILVCVGATLLALIQEELTWQAIEFAKNNPKLIGTLSSDEARLTAQIVSGVGFLGAGTIIMNKQSVTGLTTAASLWAVAGIGIALGMGMYYIAAGSLICIMLALTAITYFLPIPNILHLYVELEHGDDTHFFIHKHMRNKGITVENTELSVERKNSDTNRRYSMIYTLSCPRDTDENEMLVDLSKNENIRKLRIVK